MRAPSGGLSPQTCAGGAPPPITAMLLGAAQDAC